jgi:prolyl-tRNA editing enzyme YbaK/EbsC (Cys-tRNA(Pro) deacylase)
MVEVWNMSLQSVIEHLKKFDKDTEILQYEGSSATVQQAADVLGVIPARIAKTLSLKVNDETVIIVTAGDAKIDNAKFKSLFKVKAKMLSGEEVPVITGHPIGGVCPFGLANPLPVYFDVSLKRFKTVFPACGSVNSAIEVTCEELEQIVETGTWIDVCKEWEPSHLEV